MKKIGMLFILFLFSFSALSNAGDQERAVLKALEKLKGTMETGGTDKELDSLVTDAHVEINILKRDCENECFLTAVEKPYLLYKKAIDQKKTIRNADFLSAEYKSQILTIKIAQLQYNTSAGDSGERELEEKRKSILDNKGIAEHEFPSTIKQAQSHLVKAYECLSQ